MSYKIINMWVPSNKYNIKSPFRMKADTLTVHNTANTAPARNEVAYMRRNNNQTSFHVAGDHKEVVQAIGFDRIAWAAGDGFNGPGNRRSIHYEICYSMDNGYGGSKSSRYKQAEENAALYIAHVFHQFKWRVNRLRQHWDWTRKDCPHKIRATKTWNWFVRRVQEHLNVLNGTKGVSPQPKPKATGSTYKVKSGDSLWAIAKANDVSVANLMDWNDLDSSLITIGQTLKMKAPNNSSGGQGTGGAGNIQYLEDTWNTNRHGTHWVKVKAKFIVGNQEIQVYDDAPFVNPSKQAPTPAYPGNSIDIFELARQDGHVWGGYRTGGGQLRYIPIKRWNGGGGRVTNSGLWGKFI